MALRHLPLAGDDDAAPRGLDHRTKGLLRLTMACNERCPFCNVPVEDYARPTPPREETFAELEAFLAAGEPTLTISGGEPTLLRKRLLEVISRARGRAHVELQTNAVLIDAGYAGELAAAGLGSAFVSLLSDDARLHDELAGREGAFPRCLSGIDALADAGIIVTLNPVIARATQARVARYVDFVAERLPRVRQISLSAVQPHGRAARDPALLPDYAVLGPEVRRARARAAHHGILLLNPYCGLPLCVGWEDGLEHSVEAVEERSHRARGVDNRGNKRHGEPCRACALRARCGGAWHAVWDAGASGIAPPVRRREPWHGSDRWHTVVAARGAPGERELAALRAAGTPAVWLVARSLAAGDAARVEAAGCTDVAIVCATPEVDDVTLAELAALPREVIRAVVGLRALGSFHAAYAFVARVAGAGVEAVRLLVRGDERHRRFARAAQAELGVEVTV
jgi:MoaA/NifB/PqqE/SkfB family radical SAM enzyme